MDRSFKLKPFVPFDEAKLPPRSDSELLAVLIDHANGCHSGHLKAERFFGG